MGKQQSKLVRPNANVINEVKVVERELSLFQIEICLILITIFLGLSFALKIYSMHNKILKKKYILRANSMDRV